MSMFSFQAIHNEPAQDGAGAYVVYRLCQCSLFKQFTTVFGYQRPWYELFIDYVNVLFSSNSQLYCCSLCFFWCCLSIMSMFSFQAIHNVPCLQDSPPLVVYRLCQCSLFKQFTTVRVHLLDDLGLFIDYVNVLFSSNSQPNLDTANGCICCLSIMSMFSFQAIHNNQAFQRMGLRVVYRLCQCSLFKQFTTDEDTKKSYRWLFIDYVNVLFSSNSQHLNADSNRFIRCLSIMSMFSFQAIHNQKSRCRINHGVVYRLCQCSLFKQFTTVAGGALRVVELFIDYVNVLFSSNSQPAAAVIEKAPGCLSIMSMFSFQAIHN